MKGVDMQTNTKVEASDSAPAVSVQGLTVAYGEKEVLHGVDLSVGKGEIYAVVGASGSGKSTFLSTILGLYASDEKILSGDISIFGTQTNALQDKSRWEFRRDHLGYVPQDPMTNLNPSMRVGKQIEDALLAGGQVSRKEARRATITLMSEVGIDDPERRMHQFPHEFSGGMCQRILIAIAISRNPALIIADEPTSALDVTVQKTILDHMVSLVKNRGITLLFITHNLGLAAERADHIGVMHDGRIIESGTAEQIVLHPQQEYTKRLISSDVALSHGSQGERTLTKPDDMQPALFVDDVSKLFTMGSFHKQEILASNHISFTVPKGTTTALVGESGSGKTTLARMILGLEQPSSGRIIVDGNLVDAGDREAMKVMRTYLQPVFQNPYASLDPSYTVMDLIQEPLNIVGEGSAEERSNRVLTLLDYVDLPHAFAHRRPDQLSGGQRQRIAIARALAIHPKMLILDEAVSALDVLVQNQILSLLRKLQQEFGYTYLLITHDLGVARYFCDNVVVLYKGTVQEQGSIETVFNDPQSEYTKKLLNAIPHANFR